VVSWETTEGWLAVNGDKEASAAFTNRKGWEVVIARALESRVLKKVSKRVRLCSTLRSFYEKSVIILSLRES
jgi:hypothetical protein